MNRPFDSFVSQLRLETIVQTTNRLPYTEAELRHAVEAVKVRHRRGADLVLGSPPFISNKQEFIEMTDNGLLFVWSEHQLRMRFVFVKCDAGRSLFRRQKAVYQSYLSDLHDGDDWTPSTVFKSFAIAITSIGNIYRAQGYR